MVHEQSTSASVRSMEPCTAVVLTSKATHSLNMIAFSGGLRGIGAPPVSTVQGSATREWRSAMTGMGGMGATIPCLGGRARRRRGGTPPHHPITRSRRGAGAEGARALHGWSGGSGRPWEGFGGAVDRGQLAKARVRRAASPPRLPKRRRRARAPRAGAWGVAGTSVTCTQSTAGAFGMHSGVGRRTVGDACFNFPPHFP